VREAQERVPSKASPAFEIWLTRKYPFRYLGDTQTISAQLQRLNLLSLNGLRLKSSTVLFVQYVSLPSLDVESQRTGE
jgi:hypothetical protein